MFNQSYFDRFNELMNWIEGGQAIRSTFDWILKIIGVIVGLGTVVTLFYGLYASYYFIKLPWVIASFSIIEAVFNTFQAFIVSLLFVVFIILLGAVYVRFIFKRSWEIKTVTNQRYTVVPVFCQVQRLLGDLGLTTGLMGTLGGGLHALFSFLAVIFSFVGIRLVPPWLIYIAPNVAWSNYRFIDPWERALHMAESPWHTLAMSVVVMVGSFVGGVLLQMIMYWSAELQIVLVDIAQNTSSEST